MAINLHPGQSQIINDLFVKKEARYAVVCASRGFGKSYLAATAAILACQELINLPADVPNKSVAIIAPTYQQCVDLFSSHSISVRIGRALCKNVFPQRDILAS